MQSWRKWHRHRRSKRDEGRKIQGPTDRKRFRVLTEFPHIYWLLLLLRLASLAFPWQPRAVLLWCGNHKHRLRCPKLVPTILEPVSRSPHRSIFVIIITVLMQERSLPLFVANCLPRSRLTRLGSLQVETKDGCRVWNNYWRKKREN